MKVRKKPARVSLLAVGLAFILDCQSAVSRLFGNSDTLDGLKMGLWPSGVVPFFID